MDQPTGGPTPEEKKQRVPAKIRYPCPYCGVTYSKQSSVAPHIGQCKKFKAYKEYGQYGFLVRVGNAFFRIYPKKYDILEGINTLKVGLEKKYVSKPEEQAMRFSAVLSGMEMAGAITFQALSESAAREVITKRPAPLELQGRKPLLEEWQPDPLSTRGAIERIITATAEEKKRIKRVF